MDPELPWLERSPNFPAESSCMLIVHITRWKDVRVSCRDPTEIAHPALHHKWGLTCLWHLESHVESTASNVVDAWQFFNKVRNHNITVSNRKRDLNSHLNSRSVRIVILRLVYITELSLIHRHVSWIHEQTPGSNGHTQNQIEMRPISLALAKIPPRDPHHSEQVAWLPLGTSRDSLRQTSQV